MRYYSFFFLVALSCILISFDIPSVNENTYSLLGTWKGKVDKIFASKTDTIWGPNSKIEEIIQEDSVFTDVRFNVTFYNKGKFKLSGATPFERKCIRYVKEYLKIFDLVEYELKETRKPSILDIKFRTVKESTKVIKTYIGTVTFLSQDKIKLKISLDDPTKSKTLILKRV